jgi:hypothetical protein
MRQNRRKFLQTIGAGGVGATFAEVAGATEARSPEEGGRSLRYLQIDVFTRSGCRAMLLRCFRMRAV